MSNRGYDFRKWIEAGFKDYGKDPWFFIRELAQNSRDAGAAFIRVKIGYTSAKEEVLVFEDDGCGMSYQHAVRYLFRLYASSKAKEKYAA
ncbi:MAG: ATP-binding protein, partial [Candidatus Aminicenantes bacterium]